MFKCAAVFSNHMVLQQGKKIIVFGTGEAGASVEAELTRVDVGKGEAVMVSLSTCRVSADGTWELFLAEAGAGTGYELEVSCAEEKVVFTDVAVGEVYLAGGQSNMEREMKDCPECLPILEKGSIDEDIRYYYTQKRAYFDDAFYEDEANTSWQLFDSEGSRAWSSVGFFFARKLARELGCPVGILGCNWGGTSACAWMGRERILASEKTRIYVEEYDNSPDVIGKTEDEQIAAYKAYEKYQEEWQKKCDEQYATVPDMTWNRVQEIIGPCPYPGPINCASPQRPAGLYETMIKRVRPYTLRGFIFYQGENDSFRPDAYYDLLSNMIRQWREDWRDDNLPFLMVQLTMNMYSGDEDNKGWCGIREAQMKVYRTVKNTGIAVIIDQGQFNEIHPVHKEQVGERLALQALYHVYGWTDEYEAFGPVYSDFEVCDGGIELSFEHCKGFEVRFRDYGERPWETEEKFRGNKAEIEEYCRMTDAGEPFGFEVAGEDRVFYPARAELRGDKIFVCSDKIRCPAYARYLWTNYSEVNLFGASEDGRSGLPVAPFRTVEQG